MKRAPILLVAAMLSVSPSAVYAGNQDTGSTTTPPPGSYQQSCMNISVDGTTLNARCRDTNGVPNFTQLKNYPSAQGHDIANCDGVLTIGSCANRR